MFRKLLFMILISNFASFGDNKAIESNIDRTDTMNSASKTRHRYGNENLTNNASRSERLSERVIDYNSKKQPATLSENKLCPYESRELCLIFSLSKIAKVQVATLDNETAMDRSFKSNIFDGVSKETGNSKINEERRDKEEVHSNFGKRNEDNQNSSEIQMKSPNVHCRGIRDVYIPDVQQNLPAFACTFGNNTFILSSERFLQDRRSYLDIKIDQHRLQNIKLTPKLPKGNRLKAIPVTLILNVIDNGYRIDIENDVSTKREVDQAEGNR
ncbi:uncharacterized protein LOC108628873 [Ceratina calcarata]|uniref:Uncharacterized protein LOC108628873 n=1 Tax=Ceratina calcarata TaxID=156304 RepID=A0AAJ7J8D3_9HYME|nr:uncharacterized protein LOC108628873 [Ceratina calcarata]